MSDADGDDMEEDVTTSSTAAVTDSKKHARAQHNALERRRRDNIKDMYGALKDTIPEMKNERASRVSILKKAITLIMARQDILDRILAENRQLEEENESLEREIETIKYPPARKVSDETSARRTAEKSVTGSKSVGEHPPPIQPFPNRKRPAPTDEQSGGAARST